MLTVYDDFTPSEAGVSHGTTNDEVTTGVDVIFGIFVQIFGGDYSLDNFFDDIFTESCQSHLFRMLGGNDHGVNSGWHTSSILKFVITCDLKDIKDFNKAENADFQSYTAGTGYNTMLI